MSMISPGSDGHPALPTQASQAPKHFRLGEHDSSYQPGTERLT